MRWISETSENQTYTSRTTSPPSKQPELMLAAVKLQAGEGQGRRPGLREALWEAESQHKKEGKRRRRYREEFKDWWKSTGHQVSPALSLAEILFFTIIQELDKASLQLAILFSESNSRQQRHTHTEVTTATDTNTF